MKILIADDEGPARLRLLDLLIESGYSEAEISEATTGKEVLDQCQADPMDLVLLDIQMPEMDGLTAAARLAELPEPPAVIFTTAYDQHALAAFEAQAIDYLLKPIRRDRLQQALERARQPTRPQLEALQEPEDEMAYLSSTFRGGLQRLPIDRVIYFHAESKYVVARHGSGEMLLDESLKQLEDRFGGRFERIHRNAMVAPGKVSGLVKDPAGHMLMTFVGIDDQLEVSRRHLPGVRRWLKG